jgi:putative ABC transport system permease protein
MRDLWLTLPAWAQDGLLLAALLAPTLALGTALLRGYAPWTLLGGLLRRHAGVAAVFVALIAASVALGTAVVSQERALREGTARAAEPFDLVVAAPGSEVTAMLAAVYLQPASMPLLGGETYERIASAERVRLAAPLAFGDSHRGAPVVGTTAAFVQHLAGGVAEGRPFEARGEVVAGASAPAGLGEAFSPAHGVTDPEEGAHGGLAYRVVGVMPPTGSPWDRALLVPVESVWAAHGLADGHAEADAPIGPPFDPSHFPGTPAALVVADSLGATYQLQARFTTSESMAFFPGAVLFRLHGVLGDVGRVMSAMTLATQGLVAAGVLTGLALLMRLVRERLALLRALGAPRRFVMALCWSYAGVLIAAGAGLGLGLGWVAAGVLSGVLSARTEVALDPSLGWTELHLVAGFASAASLLAVLPALAASSRGAAKDLRR